MCIRDRCNNWLQFLIRDDKLHLHVTIRSNDAMWGWSGINTFEWSLLHEMVATELAIDVGPVTYFIGNLHLYEPHWNRAMKIVEYANSCEPLYGVNGAKRVPFDVRFDVLDKALDMWFDAENTVRQRHVRPE